MKKAASVAGFEIVRAPHPIVDIGINLAHKDFSADLKQILERCKSANVTSLILTGTSLKSSRECVRMAKELADCGLSLQATVGQHPHDAKHYEHAAMVKLAESSNVAIVGECGIDFDR